MATQEREILPLNVTPTHYDISLTPNFDTFKFDGLETVNLQVNTETSFVLEISEAYVEQNGKRFPSKFTLDEKLERVTVNLEGSLSVGEATLTIKFVGSLNDKLCGFYRSSYEVEGQKKWLASTQFEAVDARKAFPCWDEPAVKATFSITLTTPSDMEALSNMPSESVTTNDQGKKVFKFGKTPKMSTYIVAFAVGNFEYIEGHTKEGVQVRIYTTPGKKHLGQFSLDVTVKTLSYYNDYFGIPYPLAKVDQLAVPDFAMGAMENWGLITYREIALLIDDKQSSAGRKMRVAETVAHELAHQWFGNLVTMEWWTDLWLNEGFATWVANLALNYLYPNWNIWEIFLTAETVSAFRLDALESSHPIEVPLYEARKIDEIFDEISYAKGGSVIRMISEFLGESTFRDGLRIYLKRHAYGNAKTTDLWAALAEASNRPVQEIMGSWTQQLGYPVISVKQEGDELVLSQSQFLSNGKRDKSTQWVVPITLKTSAGQSLAVVMDQAETRVKVSVPAGGWVKLNVDQAGFYRVHYESGLFQALCGALKSRQLSTMDRFGVVNDAFALTAAQYLTTADLIQVMRACSNEDEYIIIADLAGSLDKLLTVFHGTGVEDLIKAFANTLFASVMKKVGWTVPEDEAHQRKLLRTVLVGALGNFSDKESVTTALKLFSEGPVHPDIRQPVFSIVASSNGQEGYDDLCAIYRKNESSEEQVRVLRGLGGVSEPALIKQALDFVKSDEVRNQDSVFLFESLGTSHESGDLPWKWLQENWSVIEERYGKGGSLLNSFISAAVEKFNTEELRQSVVDFFEKVSVPTAEKAIAQALEYISLNIAWRNRDVESLRKAFS